MSRLPRPCLGCGKVIRSGSYCTTCDPQSKRGTTRERFGPGWARISREVIQRDGGICCLCGLPGADTTHHLNPRMGRPQHREADKRELAAAHRACNSRKGAR
jgi:5-methylcytosine-specific restriction endonuclease McrA